MSRFVLFSVPMILLSLISSERKKPSILIIGDSISLGYTPFVENHFINRAKVFHNSGNAQHTGTGLENIEAWIGDEKWDIIQFNWGLWDLCYRHETSKAQGNRDKINGNITYNLDDYSKNIDNLISIIKRKSKAQLIFVTTTYVPENEAGRYKEDAILFNKAAIKIMNKHGVLVNDIYKSSIDIHKNHSIGPVDVHYTDYGYKELSKLIIDFLESELKSLKCD